MIVNGQDLYGTYPLSPMEETKKSYKGFSYGLTECGYDIRLKQGVWLHGLRRFVLRSSVEMFHMPNHLMGTVMNKSTLARMGVDASMTTNIEPGWCGYLTIELCYKRWRPLYLPAGIGICQIIFHEIQNEAEYTGKYQNQADKPVAAIKG